MPGTPDQVDLDVTVKEQPTGTCSSASASPAWRSSRCRPRSRRRTSSAPATSCRCSVNSGKSTRSTRCRYLDPYFTVDGVSRASTSTTARPTPPTLAVGAVRHRRARRRRALRRPVHRGRHGLPRRQPRAHASSRRSTRSPLQLLRLSCSSSATSTSYGAVHRRLGARHARQPDHHARRAAACALTVEVGRRRPAVLRACGYQQPVCTSADRARCTLLAQRRARLRRRPRRQAAAVLQELLRRRPGLGARLRHGSLGPADVNGNAIGGNRKVDRQRWSCSSRARARQRPDAAPRVLRRRRQRLRRRRDSSSNDLRASAGLGLCWTSPFGPLRCPSRSRSTQEHGDKIQRLQFQLRDRLLRSE